MKWYAYRHVNDSLHIRRYWDQGDIQECIESPFVKDVTQAYDAETHNEAEFLARVQLFGEANLP